VSAIERLHEATFLLVKLEVGGASDRAPVEALLREIARSDGVPSNAAGLLVQAAEHLSAPGSDGDASADLLREVVRLVDRAVEAVESPLANIDSTDAFAADPEMVDGFIVESLEFLESAERAALEMEAAPGNADAIDTLFRCFHTMKGTAGFLGLPQIVALAHRAESLLSLIREVGREADAGEIELVFRSVDTLRALVAAISAPGEEVACDELAAALDEQVNRARVNTSTVRSSAAPAATPPPVPAQQLVGSAAEFAGASDWTRVRTDRLDNLIEGLGELLVAQSILTQDPAIVGARHSELALKAEAVGKIVRDLQQLAISMRTVSLSRLFRKTARMVRELSRGRGAPITLELDGESTVIDRNMVDLLADPVVHMIRNAVDHGIETPDERRAAGKAPEGLLRLRASNAGSEVVLELSDDGRGLDRSRIRDRAVERGLIEAEAELSDADLLRLIFMPGFSTAREVTNLSGRGVGMDVVRRNIEALHGRIDVRSEDGAGTVFTLRVPLTLAITDGLLVRVGSERFVIPSRYVHLSFRPEPSAVTVGADVVERVLLRDRELPLVRLHDLLGIAGAEEDPAAAVLVVVGTGAGRRAILADELLAQVQVVSKPLGSVLEAVPWLTGGAILGDGRVGLILDVPAIAAAVEDLAEQEPVLAETA
jgi:two-component system chemotaxis sensor kinase CheA